ncbi:GTP-binding protein [Magnetospirillum fulvum]|uniref:Hydrogenase maturation factor HypB n=1 Tax=Magnetospirillum fulvum TaxID=1082 RepID=A0A1H6JGM8_MAGFU|nr:GTP-binding protein [Magnetospirillum fulvum]SEH58249.1 Ni2+-binding GTPase involved in regulation of expression and maturation of urease and hydrogenase [Magnetospirillum fulvum]
MARPRLVTVAGSPSVGKTSVILRVLDLLAAEGQKVGVAKFDSLSTEDDKAYARRGIPVSVGLSGGLCPDHFFVTNIEACLEWGQRQGLDLLVSESAGLCNRCSPHIEGVLAVCVVDALAGIHTPKKIGPMLRLADLVVITKGDIVSQAEREVYAYNVRLANPRAPVVFCNGITGQGATEIAFHLRHADAIDGLEGRRLRFSMPSAVCPYCVGETAIGETHHRGNVKTMCFEDQR